jgi:hypothetical protein
MQMLEEAFGAWTRSEGWTRLLRLRLMRLASGSMRLCGGKGDGTTGSVFRFTTCGAEIKTWLDAPCQSDSNTVRALLLRSDD